MMQAIESGEVSYRPKPVESGAQSAATEGPSIEERQSAWRTRIECRALTAARLTRGDMSVLEKFNRKGVEYTLLYLNLVTYQHGLENLFNTKCLSFELLG